MFHHALRLALHYADVFPFALPQLCLVTGASSGLGLHFAKTLAKHGAKVSIMVAKVRVVRGAYRDSMMTISRRKN